MRLTKTQVNHYPSEEQNEKNPNFNYVLANGSLYTGTNPPANSTPKGYLYPRSAAVGGCVNHNALIMMYPFGDDWSQIENITGDTTWDSEQMRTYFERLENCQYLSPPASGHGFDGWLSTNRAEESIFLGDDQVLDMLQVDMLSLQGVAAMLTDSRQHPRSPHRQ
jgi:choline dehydrogenase